MAKATITVKPSDFISKIVVSTDCVVPCGMELPVKYSRYLPRRTAVIIGVNDEILNVINHDNQAEPCGECDECSTFCDVCGIWYWNEDKCEVH